MRYVFKKFTWKNWLCVGLIFAFTLLQVFFTMQIVDTVKTFNDAIGEAAKTGNNQDIWRNGFWMIICAVCMCVAQVVIQFLASFNAARIATQLRDNFYKKVNKFALSDLAGFSTESLITRSTNDIQNIHTAFLYAFRTIFVAPITMVWSIIKLVRTASAPLTVSTAVWLVILIVVVIVLIVLVMPRFNRTQKLMDDLNTASRENLTGVRVVRAFNAEKYQEGKFEVVNEKYTKLMVFVGRAVALFTPFVMFVMMGLTLTLLWVTAYLINGQSVQVATETFKSANSFVMLASQIVMSFVLLITIMILWPRACVCANRIKEVMLHPESVQDPEVSKEFTEKGTIEFKNVGFAYPGSGKEAVSGVTFKVNQGETIAFIGATGSGKTTIINMIPRFADATSGEVFVDGVNVKEVSQEQLRNVIGYTPQRGFLFKGNIRENIAFSNPNLSLKQIQEAAKIAEADSFISAKSEQYESAVAQGGTNFSGGQKQRLCIARSVAKKPEILIFDDSFSALDYKTDKTVRANIKNQLPGTTRVIIAQRVGTIMDADQIVVLDKGQVVGLGKHQDLINDCAVYKEIALSQLSAEELGIKKGGK
ncbi:MAG: ABC transporter ATP-binding protein [Firmicutes bacterium]|nr:ABC transporter ATP-binding protein [Candidatus Fiminaster equi]